jgi:predicted ester cyclase
LRGPEGFIEAIKVLHNAFADLHYEEGQIVVSKDKVVAVMSVRGRHIGENAGIPATGRSFSTSAVEIFKIANGKIIEHRAFRDRLRFLIQVGVLGPSSSEYELVFQTLKDSASK